MIERLPELVNGNAPLVHRGRYLSVDFLVAVGERAYVVTIKAGKVARVDGSNPLMRPWRFAIRADAAAWAAFWEEYPRPGFHDIFAMAKAGEMRIEGDLQPLMANLRYIKDVLAAPRSIARAA